MTFEPVILVEGQLEFLRVCQLTRHCAMFEVEGILTLESTWRNPPRLEHSCLEDYDYLCLMNRPGIQPLSRILLVAPHRHLEHVHCTLSLFQNDHLNDLTVLFFSNLRAQRSLPDRKIRKAAYHSVRSRN